MCCVNHFEFVSRFLMALLNQFVIFMRMASKAFNHNLGTCLFLVVSIFQSSQYFLNYRYLFLHVYCLFPDRSLISSVAVYAFFYSCSCSFLFYHLFFVITYAAAYMNAFSNSFIIYFTSILALSISFFP